MATEFVFDPASGPRISDASSPAAGFHASQKFAERNPAGNAETADPHFEAYEAGEEPPSLAPAAVRDHCGRRQRRVLSTNL
jgi:hypothetical protein